MRVIAVLGLFVLTLSLSACYEDTEVTLHEAHVYKGKADPHEGDPAARAERLRHRFRQVQTDR